MSSDYGLHGMSDERALKSLDRLYETRHGGDGDRWRVLGNQDERAWQPESFCPSLARHILSQCFASV